jgi:hypothetical protein
MDLLIGDERYFIIVVKHGIHVLSVFTRENFSRCHQDSNKAYKCLDCDPITLDRA